MKTRTYDGVGANLMRVLDRVGEPADHPPLPPMVPDAEAEARNIIRIAQGHPLAGALTIITATINDIYHDGYTAAASRLRNPSEEDVERGAQALHQNTGGRVWDDLGPSEKRWFERQYRAALLAAAEMLEGKP